MNLCIPEWAFAKTLSLGGGIRTCASGNQIRCTHFARTPAVQNRNRQISLGPEGFEHAHLDRRCGVSADEPRFQIRGGAAPRADLTPKCKGSNPLRLQRVTYEGRSTPRGTARFRRYELVSVCEIFAMEAPLLPPVSAGLFSCLVFDVFLAQFDLKENQSKLFAAAARRYARSGARISAAYRWLEVPVPGCSTGRGASIRRG